MSCDTVFPAPECVTGSWYNIKLDQWFVDCTSEDWTACWCSMDAMYESGLDRWTECPSTPPLTPKPTTLNPTAKPTPNPTIKPTINPSPKPTVHPTLNPTDTPNPTLNPTLNPSLNPSIPPTFDPSSHPSFNPSSIPSLSSTFNPSNTPTFTPTYTERQIADEISTFPTQCDECDDSINEISALDDSLIPIYLWIGLIIILNLAVVLCILCIFVIRKRQKRNKSKAVQEHIRAVTSSVKFDEDRSASDETNAVEMKNMERFDNENDGTNTDNYRNHMSNSDCTLPSQPQVNEAVQATILTPGFNSPSASHSSLHNIGEVQHNALTHTVDTVRDNDEYIDQCIDCGEVKKGKKYESLFYCAECIDVYNYEGIELSEESRDSSYEELNDNQVTMS